MAIPSNSRNCLLILEFSENVRVRVGLHEHFREFLFLVSRFVLLFPMIQQHVNLADEQCFGIFEFCKEMRNFEQLIAIFGIGQITNLVEITKRK